LTSSTTLKKRSTVAGAENYDSVPLVRARSGRSEQVFMITGFGIHDRMDCPFTFATVQTPQTLRIKVPQFPIDSVSSSSWVQDDHPFVPGITGASGFIRSLKIRAAGNSYRSLNITRHPRLLLDC
jgi:hypothetical protein